VTDVAALLVAVEKSDIGDLPGSINTTIEFRDWLTANKVSSERILMLGVPGAAAPTLANVRGAVREIKQRPEKTLFLFWAGHGASQGKRRVLYLADSREAEQVLDLESLLEELRADAPATLTTQLVFVDACAVDQRKLKEEYRFHAFRFRERSFRSQKAQYAFFATQHGQAADFSKDLGEYSRVLLKHLREVGLPLDARKLAEHVNAEFASRHAAGLRVPSEYWYVGARGETTEWEDAFDLRKAVASYVEAIEAELAAEYLLPDEATAKLETRPGHQQPVRGALRQELARPATKVRIVPEPNRALPDVPVDQFLAQHRCVVLFGPPGFGKSTLLRQLFQRFGAAWRDVSAATASDGRRIPFLIRLNRWRQPSQTLLEFVAEEMQTSGVRALAERLTDLMKGPVVFLLDGLNELPDVDHPPDGGAIRDPRVSSIRTTVEKCETVACVLSCRPNDFSGEPLWRDLHILPLDPPQVGEFARHAFMGDEDAEQLAEQFVHALYHRDDERARRLQKLASEPFYLTKLLAYFHQRRDGNLPDNHAAVLSHAVDVSIADAQQRQQIPADRGDTLQTRLACLAFNMTDDDLLSVADQDLAGSWLLVTREQEFSDGSGGYTESLNQERQKEAKQTRHWAAAAGLLSISKREIRFFHHILQEYFCAKFCLSAAMNESMLQRATFPQFREVWRFCRELSADSSLLQQVLSHLRSGFDHIRRDAATALGWLGDSRAIDSLSDALRDPYTPVQEASAVALGDMGDRQAVPPLLDRLNDRNSLDMDVRLKIIASLGRLEDSRSIEPLLDELETGDHELTLMAARALAWIGPAAAAPLSKRLPMMSGLARKDGERALEWIGRETPGPAGNSHETASEQPRGTFVTRLRSLRQRTSEPP
jgi:hypothetical protein